MIRQTGRHALASITQETQVECVDGRYVNTGFPPRHAKDYASLRDWVDELGYRDEFDEIVLLDLAVERGGVSLAQLREDPLTAEIYGAGRSALVFLAAHLTPEEFFVGAQERGIAVGAVWSPEEAFDNEHFVARGFPVGVEREDIGRTITYPGAFLAPKSPWRISRRPPHIGEHQAEVFPGLTSLSAAPSHTCGDERAKRASCSPGASGRGAGTLRRSERRIPRRADPQRV